MDENTKKTLEAIKILIELQEAELSTVKLTQKHEKEMASAKQALNDDLHKLNHERYTYLQMKMEENEIALEQQIKSLEERIEKLES